jgi:hypothetical protein
MPSLSIPHAFIVNAACFRCQYRSRAGFIPDQQAPGALPPGDFRREVSCNEAVSFLHQQMPLNLACCGWLEPTYYGLGSAIPRAGM